MLLLLLSLWTGRGDVADVDVGIACSAVTPGSPVNKSLLKASKSKAGRDDLLLLLPPPFCSPLPEVGGAVDLRGTPANRAKVA